MGRDKLWAEVGGRPLIAWAIEVFGDSPLIEALVVVARKASIGAMKDLLGVLGVVGQVVEGGSRRQDSVRAGLEVLPDADWVVVHDGARPCVPADLIARGLEAARATGAALAAVPVVDTLKWVENGTVTGTANREALWAAQTPQVFRRELLWRAHQAASGEATDDSALVEALGVPVHVFMGDTGNIKVTTMLDLQIVDALLRTRGVNSRSSVSGEPEYGFDVEGEGAQR